MNVNSARHAASSRPVTASSASSRTSSSSAYPQGSYPSNGDSEGSGQGKKGRKPTGRLRLSKKAGLSQPGAGAGQDPGAGRNGRDRVHEDDDDWTFEGGHGDDAAGRRVGESMEVVRDLPQPMSYSAAASTVTLPDQARDKERESKGRRLVKKTSQLFGRKDKDKERDKETISSNPSSSSSSVFLPIASRQSSKSSGDSQDIVNQRRPLASRVPSGGSTITTNGGSSGGGFLGLRRPSQESQAALGVFTANGGGSGGMRQKNRTGSTSTYDSSQDAPSPLLTTGQLPAQRRPSQLASTSSSSSRTSTQQTTSVPAHLPQGPSVPTRMSAWFSGLISSSAGSDSSATTQSTEPAISPLRTTAVNRGPSAAASFLNAARQKAVEGVRNLLDSEAQPDRCTDPIWLMGVSHPGYSPPPPTPPFGQAMHDIPERGRPGSAGPGSHEGPLSTPPPVEREKGLRAGFQRRQLDRGQGSPAKGLGQLFGGSTASLVGSPSKESVGRADESPNRAKKGKEKEVLKWPEQFYTDFRSTVWCTYRSQYAPIVALPQDTLIPSAEHYFAAFGPPADIASPRMSALPEQAVSALGANGLSSKPSAWGWGRTEERGLTSDAGWGCMLRTGQSMLANALISLHLGRDWRVPSTPPSLEPTTPAELVAIKQYATYARILSYFLDDPSPLVPFSVHRMALIGKALGKEVGEWFGPSTAQGALKTLANAFPLCGLTVVGGADGTIYRSEVLEASNADDGEWAAYMADPASPPVSVGSYRSKRMSRMPVEEPRWGKKAVLVLVGLRLGLDGVNPIYHDSIKALFTFPQSVGIAGGRPSSSYYFVASQANSLFYLDPHFTRPAIPLETPPSFAPQTAEPATSSVQQQEQPSTSSASSSPNMDRGDDILASSITIPASEAVDNEEAVLLPEMSASAILSDARAQGGEPSGSNSYRLDMVDADDLSSGSDHSFSPTRPRRAGGVDGERLERKRGSLVMPAASRPSPTPVSPPQSPFFSLDSRKSSTATDEPDVFSASTTAATPRPTMPVDAETRWYASAYAEAQLKTYHCDKVRKIPLSALDPSMLLGFLIRDEADFEDFCKRVGKLPQKIFSVQDEPPIWDDAASAGLESVSEPDFSSDEDGDDSLAIHSPLSGSLTLPARRPGGGGETRRANGDGAEREVEDLSATVRSLGMGLERDETVRGVLSGVVDASAAEQDVRKGQGSPDDPYDSMPPTPRVTAPPGFFSRPSVVLVQQPEADEPRNAIPPPIQTGANRQ